MFEQISTFFTIEMIYLWLNIGVIPFWFLLIFFPNSKVCGFFVTSIFPIFILTGVYLYLLYNFYSNDYNFLNNFNLYLGFEHLRELFSSKSFIMLFWTHFLAINLFCGGWIVRDSQKISMSRSLVILPIVITYFIGPFGIFFYWLFRIFVAKRISLYD